jgi:hypothetical protein
VTPFLSFIGERSNQLRDNHSFSTQPGVFRINHVVQNTKVPTFVDEITQAASNLSVTDIASTTIVTESAPAKSDVLVPAGASWLLFGCRDTSKDFLLQTELVNNVESGELQVRNLHLHFYKKKGNFFYFCESSLLVFGTMVVGLSSLT